MLALGAAGGFFASDFAAYRTDIRTSERAAIEQSQAVAKELQAILAQFASIAQGKQPKTEPDIEKLRTVLLNDQEIAKQLVRFDPSAEPVFQRFENSATAVLSTAENLDGPLTAKQMSDAVEQYLYTRGQFHDALASSLSSYL